MTFAKAQVQAHPSLSSNMQQVVQLLQNQIRQVQMSIPKAVRSQTVMTQKQIAQLQKQMKKQITLLQGQIQQVQNNMSQQIKQLQKEMHELEMIR